MSDRLLPYYQRELSFIRKMGAEFAEKHPEVAAGLRLGPDSCEDPHVERMIMAFAYLAARVRCKLDDDFPELTQSILSVLYPHYQAPVPSMAVVEFKLDPGQGALVAGHSLPRGTAVDTEPALGEPCRFETTSNVTLFPLRVSEASLGAIPYGAEKPPTGSVAVIRIGLETFSPDAGFGALQLDRLRFFLSGQAQHVFALYELLFTRALGVHLVDPDDRDRPPIVLPVERLVPGGFSDDEAVLPSTARSFPGYRILSEYFALPQKFCFVDVEGLDSSARAGFGRRAELRIWLDSTDPDLEQNVGAASFRLGCSPVVNLFRQKAEPIRLDHRRGEYRVVPDRRRQIAREVYTIDRVVGVDKVGHTREYSPLYSLHHAARHGEEPAFWIGSRRPSVKTGDVKVDHGTEMFISFVDESLDPFRPAASTIDVEVTCFNRDLPARLPFGGGRPQLGLPGGGPLAEVRCLTPPTPTLRPELGRGALWRVISHLSLNHVSIAGSDGDPRALREILKLYDWADSPEVRARIDGIDRVTSHPSVGRIRGEDYGGFCRGVEIEVVFDRGRYADNGLFLFATILERFAGLYASVNSFTRLVARTKQQSDRILKRWPPRAGDRVLV